MKFIPVYHTKNYALPSMTREGEKWKTGVLTYSERNNVEASHLQVP